MTRHPGKKAGLAKAGTEVVKGDLTNEADLQAALRGVSGAFYHILSRFEAEMDAG